jgi:hypothetical protein
MNFVAHHKKCRVGSLSDNELNLNSDFTDSDPTIFEKTGANDLFHPRLPTIPIERTCSNEFTSTILDA